MPTYPQSAYDLINRTKDILAYRITFTLRPEGWASFNCSTQFNWKKVKFDEGNDSLIPHDQIGIYAFVIEPCIASHPGCAYLVYIGMTERQSFRDRFRQYLKEPAKRKPRPRIVRMLASWPDHLFFYYAPMPNGVDVAALEEQLIEAYWPPVNREFPAEVCDIHGGIFD